MMRPALPGMFLDTLEVLAAQRPCRHDWYESNEIETYMVVGDKEVGDPIYLTEWTCWKCGQKTTTPTGERPVPDQDKGETK